MTDNQICGIVVIIGVLTTIVLVVLIVMNANIPFQDYEQIKKWQQECPELSSLIAECTEDDSITNNEYNRIERRYHILKLKSPCVSP